MKFQRRIDRFFDRPFFRWLGIILISSFVLWFSWPASKIGYEYDRTETVVVVSVRPLKSQYGGERYLLSFKLVDGRTDSMSLPKIDTLKSGHTIRIDVMTKPGKKNRYRLAQDPIQP